MKTLLLALSVLIAAPVLACPNCLKPTAKTTALAQIKPAPIKKAVQKIVVHLSDSETPNALHAAFMAIGLATGLEKMGADVTLMLDASAPNFAKKSWSGKSLSQSLNGSHYAQTSQSATLGDAFSEFVKAGGKVVMCPHCSIMCGIQDGITIPSVKIGAEGELVKLVFGADKVLDY